MGIAEILTEIDREIAQLQRARALLNGHNGRNGKKAAAGLTNKVTKRRNLTPEGRRRIAEAVRRRWERQRRAAAAK